MSGIMASLKSMVATATLSIMATTAAGPVNADVDPPPSQPVNVEAAYKSANQVASIDSSQTYDISAFQQQPPPRQEDLSMLYSVDPYTVSEYAKKGKYPLTKLGDGSVGIPVTDFGEISNNTPEDFMSYVALYFESGKEERDSSGEPYDGLAHIHVAMAVDPNDPASIAKFKELNKTLTAKIKGEDGVPGWAEKSGVVITAVVPIYIDPKLGEVPYSNPAYGMKDITLKSGDMLAVVNDDVAYLDGTVHYANKREVGMTHHPFQDANKLTSLLESQLIEGGVYYLTKFEIDTRDQPAIGVVSATEFGDDLSDDFSDDGILAENKAGPSSLDF